MIDLPPTAQSVRRAIPLSDDRWLAFLAVDRLQPLREAKGLVITASGHVTAECGVGSPNYMQAASPDCIWLGFKGSDERIFKRTLGWKMPI